MFVYVFIFNYIMKTLYTLWLVNIKRVGALYFNLWTVLYRVGHDCAIIRLSVLAAAMPACDTHNSLTFICTGIYFYMHK